MHLTDFGTTALMAALPASVGTPDVKSTCGVGIIVVLFTTDFSTISYGKIWRHLHSEIEYAAAEIDCCAADPV